MKKKKKKKGRRAMVNLANIGALRARKHGSGIEAGDDEDCRSWRRRLSSMAVSSSSLFRLSHLLLLLAAIVTACITLPVEKILKEFLIWIKQNLGPWGPLVLAIASIPLTILAVPASILPLGGGYLFGLPVGFVADYWSHN